MQANNSAAALAALPPIAVAELMAATVVILEMNAVMASVVFMVLKSV